MPQSTVAVKAPAASMPLSCVNVATVTPDVAVHSATDARVALLATMAGSVTVCVSVAVVEPLSSLIVTMAALVMLMSFARSEPGAAQALAAAGPGLPRRLLTVLEGEALFNDATALVLYAAAVTAATTGHFSVLHTAG